jgi:uncharacterized membrane protein YhaH (DUF805 family)
MQMIDLSWNTKGRIALPDYRKARWRHFMFCLIPVACYIAAAVIGGATLSSAPTAGISAGVGLSLIGTVLLFYYRYRFLQVMIKRLHDRNMSGKLLVLSPILMILVLFAGIFAVAAGAIGNPTLDRWLGNDSHISIATWAVIAPFLLFNLFLRFQMNRTGTPGPNKFGPPPGMSQAQVF